MEMKVEISKPNPRNKNTILSIEFWHNKEAARAMEMLIGKAEELFGEGSPIEISGRTRNSKGFLNPGFFLASKGDYR